LLLLSAEQRNKWSYWRLENRFELTRRDTKWHILMRLVGHHSIWVDLRPARRCGADDFGAVCVQSDHLTVEYYDDGGRPLCAKGHRLPSTLFLSPI
jgi:hypothetical protein